MVYIKKLMMTIKSVVSLSVVRSIVLNKEKDLLNKKSVVMHSDVADSGIIINEEISEPVLFTKFINHMKLRRYSRRNVAAYSSSFLLAHKWFVKNPGVSVAEITEAHVLKHFLYFYIKNVFW